MKINAGFLNRIAIPGLAGLEGCFYRMRTDISFQPPEIVMEITQKYTA